MLPGCSARMSSTVEIRGARPQGGVHRAAGGLTLCSRRCGQGGHWRRGPHHRAARRRQPDRPRGACALLARDQALEVVGVAADYDELVARAEELRPQVLVTDIRMPPTFQDEGIDAAREVRGRLPGTGVVVLSQYDDPDYAVKLLAEGADGYAYLLKDRIADARLLGRAIRDGGGGRVDDRSPDRPGPAVPGAVAGADGGRGGAAAAGRRGAVGEGHRGGGRRQPREGERPGRAALPEAGAGRVGRAAGRAQAPADAAHRDPAPRRAGRAALPAAARRAGRQAAGRPARPDRAAHRDRPDERRARLLGHRRAHRPGRAGRAAQRPPAGR